MDDFSLGDAIFILFILGVVHGIMLLVGLARRRKTPRDSPPSSE